MSQGEAYKLDCWSCKRTVEIPLMTPHKCPHCGKAFEINWHAARDEHASAETSESDPIPQATAAIAGAVQGESVLSPFPLSPAVVEERQLQSEEAKMYKSDIPQSQVQPPQTERNPLAEAMHEQLSTAEPFERFLATDAAYDRPGRQLQNNPQPEERK